MKLRSLIFATADASLAAMLLSCASQPAPVAPPATATLIGNTTATTRILIKSVDAGPTLWVAPNTIGSRVTITAGHHQVHLICDIDGSWVPTELPMDVQPGQVYELVGSPGQGASKCDVTVSTRGA